MIERVITASGRHYKLTLALALVLGLWGAWCMRNTRVDAIPDLSETQVIIFTEWMGRSPDLVEDQVTYPLVTAMLAAPKVKDVRADLQVHPLDVARLAGLPREVVLHVVLHRETAQDDVAEEGVAEMPGGRHDPSHAQRGPELRGLSRLERAGADDLLEGDDVGVDRRDDGGDPLEAGAAVEAASTVDVVGRDADCCRPLGVVLRHRLVVTSLREGGGNGKCPGSKANAN